MLSNSKQSYGWISIALHWISALLVIGLFALGFWMVELNYYSEWYRLAPHYHKSVGLLLAVLVIFRLVWNIYQPSPQPTGRPLEQKVARLTHGVLYVGLLSLFLSGYLISTADGRGIELFDWFTLPSMGEWIENQEDVAGTIHEYLAYSLIGLALLHGLAALKHHFIDKDNTLRRIINPQTQTKE